MPGCRGKFWPGALLTSQQWHWTTLYSVLGSGQHSLLHLLPLVPTHKKMKADSGLNRWSGEVRSYNVFLCGGTGYHTNWIRSVCSVTQSSKVANCQFMSRVVHFFSWFILSNTTINHNSCKGRYLTGNCLVLVRAALRLKWDGLGQQIMQLNIGNIRVFITLICLLLLILHSFPSDYFHPGMKLKCEYLIHIRQAQKKHIFYTLHMFTCLL